ncbi:MAG: M48 family metalloprotease [Thermoanaerobaculia bacterium]
MNFFEHQDQARRSTRRLVLLFLLAVIAVVAAVNGAALGIFSFGSAKVADGALGGAGPWLPQAAAGVSLATLSVIGGGTLYKTAQLAGGGGEKVASLLGGRPVDPNSGKPAERRLLNVVEEMALAAGTPVPTVYLLEKEPGINAFAAGLNTDDAVIGITRGAMELLSRDELQGVVAHEFSHILNGDMRLNFRLIGIVHGILVIGLIGYWMLRSASWSDAGREKGAGAAWLLLGLAVYAIGYIGFFFGGLIKSAVSRQREFLADAAAVQFTRNPDGLAGALKKIGGLAAGSRLKSPNAEQASHLFFGQGAGRPLFAWMATHPPLAERIRRLDPSFDGVFPEVSAVRPAAPAKERRPEGRAADRLAEVLTGGAAGRVLVPEAVAAGVGRPTATHFAYAAALLESLTPELPAAAREPASARALVCALLIDRHPEVRTHQLERLVDDAVLAQEVRRLLPAVDACRPEVRLPLLELALPALRRLSQAQYGHLKATVERLAEADRRLTLFEFTLHRQLLRHLEPTFGVARPRKIAYSGLTELVRECSLLLSALAHAGFADEEAAGAAFGAAAARLPGLQDQLSLLAPEACHLPDIDRALALLATVAPRLKAQLIEACAAACGLAASAGVERRELLRAVADALDCPVPPLLASA